jgi:hypothetical protein
MPKRPDLRSQIPSLVLTRLVIGGKKILSTCASSIEAALDLFIIAIFEPLCWFGSISPASEPEFASETAPSPRSIRTGRTVRPWRFWKRAGTYRDCTSETGNSASACLFFQTLPNKPDENCRCKKHQKSPSRTAKPCAARSSRLSIRASPAGSPTSSASPSN